MQNIILCRRCRVQVKKDNLGEFICPSCNARLCPKAHFFDGKICTYCGWEDPNYSLWQKAQKARLHGAQPKPKDEAIEIRAQYVCSNCGVTVEASQINCPNCGLLGARYKAAKATPTGATISTPARSATPAKPLLASIPREPAVRRASRPAKSDFVREVAKAERTHWLPPLRNFVRPVLVSTFLFIVIIGLVFGGIYAARFIGQNFKPGVSPPSTAAVSNGNQGSNWSLTGGHQPKTYKLSTNVVPEAGGGIIITPPSSDGTFEQGSQVILTAVPNDCYTFSYWDSIPDTSENITITMDSDKSIAANFRLKETKPPVISEVKANCNSDVSATITWLTDKPATGQVDYGKTKDYGLSAISNDELTTNHKVRITGLEPNTMYYFSVKSANECGNEARDTNMLLTLREIKYGERVGERALDFTLPYYNDDNPDSPNKAGKNETLSTSLGGKKILLNFWSTYCGACIGEFPYIREIYEDENFANKNSTDSDYVVLTICIDSIIDEAPARIKTLEDKFIDEAGAFTFPMLLDTVGQTKKDYHVWTIPKSIFIDTDGIIREIKIGRFQSIKEIENILKSLD